MAKVQVQGFKIYHDGGQTVVHVPVCRGEEFFLHLAAQGIESRVKRLPGFDRLELEEDVNVGAVQQILTQWCTAES